MADFTTYMRSSFLLTVPGKYMYSADKFLCSAFTEFIKLNIRIIKVIIRIPRIVCNMGCLDLHGSFPLSAMVCLPVLAHLSHEREWLCFCLLNWGLDSCSSPSYQYGIQRKALLWSKRAALGFWKLSSFLFCIENGYGHTAGWQDQTSAIQGWDENVMLIPDWEHLDADIFSV